MKQDGELDEVVRRKADLATNCANDLIATGSNPGQAWIQAQRAIAGRDSD